MDTLPEQTYGVGLIVFIIAAASSVGAACAAAAAWDAAAGPLIGLSAHAWMGLVIWMIVRRRLPGAD